MVRLGVALLASLAVPAHAAYTLERNSAGSNFFDGWTYWGNRDNLTNGAVNYVSQASSSHLAYVDAGTGNAIVKVDNTSTLAYGALRNSVRITTSETYGIGSLFVLDALHLPFGCSVWPAFWTHAVSWPSGGELDIFEGVNLQQTNQVALHTVAGCYSSDTNVTAPHGTLQSTNCDYTVAANQGCTFVDERNASYGEAFARQGGGVYAAELSSDAISVWFFPRDQVPADLRDSTSTPVPAGWGAPSAYYPQSSCNINQYFAPQQITLNIALCGDWAGQPGVFGTTCSGSCADLVQDPRNYDDAYFEIASVRVYTGGVDTRSRAAASAVIGSLGGGTDAQGISGASGRANPLRRTVAMGALFLSLLVSV
ncbi:hypothetical protein JCM10212_001882 [Sporobolomyces blumeae]